MLLRTISQLRMFVEELKHSAHTIFPMLLETVGKATGNLFECNGIEFSSPFGLQDLYSYDRLDHLSYTKQFNLLQDV